DVPDLTSPDGSPGIDNQLVAVLDRMPVQVATILPEAMQYAVDEGRMSILIEVVGAPDLSVDGPVGLVFRLGAGRPAAGFDGRILPQQTFELDEDPLLGTATTGMIEGDVLRAGPFETEI